MDESSPVYHSDQEALIRESKEYPAKKGESFDGRTEEPEVGKILTNVIFEKVTASDMSFKIQSKAEGKFILVLDRTGIPSADLENVVGKSVSVRIIQDLSEQIKSRKKGLPRFLCKLV